MAQQLGLQALIIPEEYGGAGFGYVELVVVLEEMGRSLLCAPYFSTVALATNALLASGDKAAKADYLPGIASGETIATLALTEDTGRWDLEAVTLTATGGGECLDARRSQDVRRRRLHRRADPRRRADQRRVSAFSRSTATPTGSRGRRSRPWTRPASRPGSSSPAPPRA